MIALPVTACLELTALTTIIGLHGKGHQGATEQRNSSWAAKDESGNGISGATVQGFLTSNDTFVGETTANSLGGYELGTVYPSTNHYLVAYKTGSPDVAGTTVNTLPKEPMRRDMIDSV